MSAAASLFSALLDAVVAAAPSFSTSIDANRVYVQQPSANGQKPYITIHLPSDGKFWPQSRWAASGNRVDTDYLFCATVTCEVSRGVAHLFGDGTTPGALNLADDLANCIESARTAFVVACPALVDYVIYGGADWREADGLINITLTVKFTTRSMAGNR